MKRSIALGLVICLIAGITSGQAPAPRNDDGAGDKLQRGFKEIGKGLTQAWDEARQSVENMGVQGRVYGRLHWDKLLQDAALKIDVRDDYIVVLSGNVATAAAKQRAEELARDTTGVKGVVNDLAVKQ